jgi:hypothetical protein
MAIQKIARTLVSSGRGAADVLSNQKMNVADLAVIEGEDSAERRPTHRFQRIGHGIWSPVCSTVEVELRDGEELRGGQARELDRHFPITPFTRNCGCSHGTDSGRRLSLCAHPDSTPPYHFSPPAIGVAEGSARY